MNLGNPDITSNSFQQKVYDNSQQVTKNSHYLMHGYRAGRVTASVCFQVSRFKSNPSLINSIMQYTTFTSRFTEYGKETEKFANKNFMKWKGTIIRILSLTG